MEYDLKKLRRDIEKKRDELDLAITNNYAMDKIFMKNVEVDSAISLYLQAIKYYEEENKKLLKKYKKIIEKDYKEEILNLIREDVKDRFKEIDEEELNHFCNNLYVLCSLKAHNIDEQEIIKQLMYRNNIFLYEMQQKGKVVSSSGLPLTQYTKLKNKYLKIIKEKL